MSSDLSEFFALLNSRAIEFIVIGGAAYNFYAPPRATKEVDIWVRPSAENVARLIDAIRDFGFPTEGLSVEGLTSLGQVVIMGRPPNRIDVLPRPAGVEWETAWERRVLTEYEGVPVAILSMLDLISAKRAAGRPRDLADLAMLEKIQAKHRR
jgi:hypothetical protein